MRKYEKLRKKSIFINIPSYFPSYFIFVQMLLPSSWEESTATFIISQKVLMFFT